MKRLVAWTLVFGLLFGVFFLLFDRGVDVLVGARLERAEQRNHEQERTMKVAEATEARLQEFEAEVAGLDRELDELGRALPDAPERERFEADVREAGTGAGVQVVAIEPSPPREREFYGVLPLEVEVRGPGASVDEFCAEVSQQVRRTRPMVLTLERAADGFSGRIQLEAFYFLPPPD